MIHKTIFSILERRHRSNLDPTSTANYQINGHYKTKILRWYLVKTVMMMAAVLSMKQWKLKTKIQTTGNLT